MRLKTAIIVFPGSISCDDIKFACNFFDWKVDFIWHKDSIIKTYDIIFIGGGCPYSNHDFSKEDILKNSRAMASVSNQKSLVVGLADGFDILCKMELLNGVVEKNDVGHFVSKYEEFSFLESDVLLPFNTGKGKFIKNKDFAADIILKYKNDNICDKNSIAGVFDYENKIIGMCASPEKAVLSQLEHYDGRKVFEFFENVV